MARMHTPPTDEQLAIVAEQLGRTPRGVLAIAYTTPDNQPAVVKLSLIHI